MPATLSQLIKSEINDLSQQFEQLFQSGLVEHFNELTKHDQQFVNKIRDAHEQLVKDITTSTDMLIELATAFEHLTKNLPVGVVVIDTVSSTVVDLNETAKRLFNVSEVGEKKFLPAYFTASDHKTHNEYRLKQYLDWIKTDDAAEPLQMPLDKTDSAGYMWILIHKNHLTKGQTILTIIDITEVKKLESNVRLLEKQVIESNNAKSQFIANMSHELRTPLHAIAGFSSLIDKHVLILQEIHGKTKDPDKHPSFKSYEQIKRFAANIHTSTSRLVSLVDDILDLAKLEANKLIPQLEKIAIVEVIDRAIDSVSSIAIGKDIVLQINPTIDKIVSIDTHMMERVLINLLSNSLKFSPEHSIITISLYDKDENVIIEVTDEGRGIPKKDLSKVFDTFTQSSTTTPGVDRGTGLGLTITKNIVESHKGTIQAKSPVPGKKNGTQMIITIPSNLQLVDNDK